MISPELYFGREESLRVRSEYMTVSLVQWPKEAIPSYAKAMVFGAEAISIADVSLFNLWIELYISFFCFNWSNELIIIFFKQLFVNKILNDLLSKLTHNFRLKVFTTTCQYKHICAGIYKLRFLTYSRLRTTTTDRTCDGFSRKYSGR